MGPKRGARAESWDAMQSRRRRDGLGDEDVGKTVRTRERGDGGGDALARSLGTKGEDAKDGIVVRVDVAREKPGSTQCGGFVRARGDDEARNVARTASGALAVDLSTHGFAPRAKGFADAVHANFAQRRRGKLALERGGDEEVRLASTKLLERAPRVCARGLSVVLSPVIQRARHLADGETVVKPAVPKVGIHRPPSMRTRVRRRRSSGARREIRHRLRVH